MSRWTRHFEDLPRQVRRDLRGLLHGNALMRLRSVHALIESGCPVVGEVFMERVPDPEPLINQTMLEGLAKRSRIETADVAIRLWMNGGKQDKAIAQVTLLNEVQKSLDLAGKSGAVKSNLSVYRLLSDLSSGHHFRSLTAFYAIKALNDRRLLPSLDGLLRRCSLPVVRRVLRLIGHLHQPSAIEAAERLIQHGPTSEHQHTGIDYMLSLCPAWRTHVSYVAVSRPIDDPTSQRIVERLVTRHFDACEQDCLKSIDGDGPHSCETAIALIGRLIHHLQQHRDEEVDEHVQRCMGLLIRLLHDASADHRMQAMKTLAELRQFKLLCLKLGDSDPRVRHTAMEILMKANPELVRQADTCDPRSLSQGALHRNMLDLLGDTDAAMRAMACQWLGENGEWWHAKLVRPLRHDASKRVREVTGKTLQSLLIKDPRHLTSLRRKLASPSPDTRSSAAKQLVKTRDPQDMEAVVALTHDEDPGVQHAAALALSTCNREYAIRAAKQLLRSPNRTLVRTGLRILIENSTIREQIDLVRDLLPVCSDAGGIELLSFFIGQRCEEKQVVLRRALQSACPKMRSYAAREFASAYPDQSEAHLAPLLGDGEEVVRLGTLRALLAVNPKVAVNFAETMATDPAGEVRCVAMEAILKAGNKRQRLLALPLVRDPEPMVRVVALHVIAGLDDPRVPGELISAMNDPDMSVSESIRQAYLVNPHNMALLKQMSKQAWRQTVNQRLKQIEEVHAWARCVGQELLGKPIRVHRSMQGLGFTHPPRRRDAPIEIYINDLPVASGKPHGVEVMKGLVLHELAHHLYDIGIRASKTCRGRARALAMGGIYDVLTDERLERGIRSRRPHWGVYFDRLASYAFAQDDHAIALSDYAKALGLSPHTLRQQVQTGQRAGKMQPRGIVQLGTADLLRTPGLMPVSQAFLVCLRCGFDPRLHNDPAVAQAVALVPANLKDMDNSGLLELTQQIAQLIGTDEDALRQLREMRRRFKASQRLIDQLEKWLQKNIDKLPDAPDSDPATETAQASRPLRRRNPRTNLGTDPTFKPLVGRESLTFNAKRHAELLRPIRPHIRNLRGYLQRLGRDSEEQHGSRRGHRLDMGAIRRAVTHASPDVLVSRKTACRTDAYIGLLIDRSGSMQGEKIELARRFGALLAESARGISQLAGHVSAFDDKTFYTLGDFHRNTIASLDAGAGNNDAAALHLAAELARKSGKRNRMLIMISDGEPTQCSVVALQTLIKQIEQEGIICAQAAVDKVKHDCFTHKVDLSGLSMDQAVARFGRMLIRLTEHWR